MALNDALACMLTVTASASSDVCRHIGETNARMSLDLRLHDSAQAIPDVTARQIYGLASFERFRHEQPRPVEVEVRLIRELHSPVGRSDDRRDNARQ